MPGRDTLAQLAEEVGLALAPLHDALTSPESFAALMAELGWDLRVIPQPIAALDSAVTPLIEVLDGGRIDAASVQAALRGIRDVISGIQAIRNQPPSTFPDTVDAAQFATEFPQQLIDFLLIDYLLNQRSPWGQVLLVFGVIRLEEVRPGPKRPAYLRRVIAWTDLARVLTDSSGVFRDAWQWGAADFRQHDFLVAVHELMTALALPVGAEPLDPAVRDALSGGSPGPEEIHDWTLRIPIVGDPRSGVAVEVGMQLFMTPATGGTQPGFAILPYAVGTSAVVIELTDTLQLTVEAAFDLSGGVAILVSPGEPPRLLVDLFAAAAAQIPARSETYLLISLVSGGGSPAVVLGSAEGSHLQIGAVSLRIGARLAFDGKLDVFGELEFTDAEIAIKPEASEADGFITTLLSGRGVTADFAFGIGRSSSQNTYLTGSGGLEAQVPIHVRLGPIEVTSATMAIKPGPKSIPISLGTTVRGDLGPVKATVEDLGFLLTVELPSSGGNLGPLDLALGFKPPRGAGLAIDVGVVSGGGFLSFDAARGEYAGALELEFADFLALKAIGLISTRMPDGSTGFSLLMVITAEFPGGLQLGYGFTLLGVGGILGLNRGMRLSAIMEGVRTGAIESVMFPRDVIANAPRILSDLKVFFPPEQGRFVIGPMAKIGWGTPTLISVSLGVIIEIPGNIAILGVLKVALPTENEAILLLQVNFAGAIEFDKRRLYFFAALFNSRVLTITIEGELGLLVAYGDQPDFVLSVGGFHPAFKPPPLPFPSPQRISINLLNTRAARIGVQGYFAVTSNTAQFGAKAELFFGFSAISVQGHIGFDALFQFSPFSFVVTISAGVSVKVFGVGLFSVSLDVTLSGPTPWQIRGTASISLLFFSIPVDIDVTWGEDRDTTLPPISVLPLLAAELTKPESWRTRSPVNGSPLVNLRALQTTEADVVLHPLGTLIVQQRAVPLDIRVDRVGTQRSADVSRCTVSVAGSGMDPVSDVVDHFALAQFQDLSDAEKLSLPAFEREHAGVELAPDGAAMASFRAVRRSARYEAIVIDTPGRQTVSFATYNATLFSHFLSGASITRSPLALAERTLRQPFGDRIRVPGDAYVVATTRDNTAASEVFGSQAQARDRLDVLLAADPNQVDELHVIPAMEVAP